MLGEIVEERVSPVGLSKATTISGIIADELAIGMINQKTTAVRIIPVVGKGVGETVEFGGLLGYGPIMPISKLLYFDGIYSILPVTE